MIATGQDLISYLKTKGKEKGKFFFSRPQDDENAGGLVSYYKDQYDLEMLERAIDIYLVQEKDVAVTVGTFVQKMGDINRKLLLDQIAKDKFAKLLDRTKQMVEGLD